MFSKLKVFDARRIYREYAFRVTVFATLSSVAAYMVGSLIPWCSPVIAAILALSAIKPTFHDTVRESIRQVVGTFFGAIFGMVFVYMFGFNLLTLTVIIAIAFITGWLLRLRAEGGITIGVTVLLVTGPLLGDIANVEARIVGVILGTVFALIASYLIMPSNPHKQILEATIEKSRDMSRLLKTVGRRVGQGDLRLVEANLWVAEIEKIVEDVKENREEIEVALKDAKWSPLLRKKDVEEVMEQVRITKANADNVRSIMLAIQKAVVEEADVPAKTLAKLGAMLVETAHGIKQQAKLAVSAPAESVDTAQIEQIRLKRRKVADDVRHLDDTQAILLSGTLLHEATKIKDAISLTDPHHGVDIVEEFPEEGREAGVVDRGDL